MKTWLENRFQLPDKTVALLIHFLNQNSGRFSKRAREKEFESLSAEEIAEIEAKYGECFD